VKIANYYSNLTETNKPSVITDTFSEYCPSPRRFLAKTDMM